MQTSFNDGGCTVRNKPVRPAATQRTSEHPLTPVARLEAAIVDARRKLAHCNDIALIVLPPADMQALVHDARTMGRCNRRRQASHLPHAFMGITLLEESGVDARYLLALDGGVHRF